jgi:ABC-2 type transport system ATP-binding protein
MGNPPPENLGPAVVIENLSKRFGETVAVKDLSLTVDRGEIFGLVGPDGAGKTTVMRMLAGILEPSGGRILVDGVSVTDDPEGAKERMAYMPQRFGLYQDLTVLENLVFYADLFQVPRALRPARMERLFEFSRLGPFQDRLAGALSGGMKQKLGLACALIHSPRVLLLDEPTNGVDPVSRRDFWRILNDLAHEGISILVSTAYLDEADRTRRVALMSHGSIITMGAPSALKAQVGGAMFELTSSEVKRARSILLKTQGVLNVNVFGDGLHVLLEHENRAESLRKELEEAGALSCALRKITPSMEDAFLSLVMRDEERSLRDRTHDDA